MIFGRLDWTSWDSILSKKSVTLGLGLVALAGSFAVLGATVLRIQNLRTTVDRPKAANTSHCSGSFAALRDTGSDCRKRGGDDDCLGFWHGFWDHNNNCANNGSTTCWIETGETFQCSTITNEAACNSKCNGVVEDSSGANTHKRCCQWVNSNPCWTNQPIPTNGRYDSSAQSLRWDWDTTYSSTINTAIIYVWTNSARSGNSYSAASANSDMRSVSLSAFFPALQPNTTYYWLVNPNSYSSPDAAHQCMSTATAGWSFTTRSAEPAATCTISLSASSVNVGQPVSISVSGSAGVLAHVSRTDQGEIPGLGNVVYTDPQGHKYYNVGSSFAPQSAGTYKFWCDVGGGSDQCSGNLFCPYEGGTLPPPACTNWRSCSNNDNATLAVTQPGCTSDSGCDSSKRCTNNQCVDVVCPAVVYACKQYVVRDHACNLDNKTSGIACTTDSGSAGTCSSGTCVQNAPVCSLSVSNLPPGPYRVGDPDKTVTISKSPANARLFCTSSNSGVVSVVGQTSGSDTATCTFHVESAGTAILTAQLQLIGDTGAGLCGDPASIEVTTQAADYCTSVSQCPDNKTCTNNVCVDVCTSAAPTCKQNVAANHACTTRNVADNTACTTGGNLPGTCQSGVCTLVCSSPQTKCGNACVNLQSDTSNCGACGNACGTGQGCYSGVCSTPKTCSVSLSSGNVTTGTPVTVTTSGSGGTVSTYISREDNQTISGFGDPRTVNGHTYYQLSGSSPYTLSGLPATRYKVWCDVTE